MRFLERSMIALDVEIADAEEAIRSAGQLLVDSGSVATAYVEAMIQSYRDKGPYFVLAPGIALAHAKADDGVLEASVALARLKQPIQFNHPVNDPVTFVFALGSSSSEEHIQLLRKLTLMLNNPLNIEVLGAATTVEEIERMLAAVTMP